jgi:hypothetical protein
MGEADLGALSERFADGEARIRALLWGLAKESSLSG